MDQLIKSKAGAVRWLTIAAKQCEDLVSKIIEVELRTYKSALEHYNKRSLFGTRNRRRSNLQPIPRTRMSWSHWLCLQRENGGRKVCFGGRMEKKNILLQCYRPSSAASLAPVKLPKLDLPKFNGETKRPSKKKRSWRKNTTLGQWNIRGNWWII